MAVTDEERGPTKDGVGEGGDGGSGRWRRVADGGGWPMEYGGRWRRAVDGGGWPMEEVVDGDDDDDDDGDGDGDDDDDDDDDLDRLDRAVV